MTVNRIAFTAFLMIAGVSAFSPVGPRSHPPVPVPLKIPEARSNGPMTTLTPLHVGGGLQFTEQQTLGLITLGSAIATIYSYYYPETPNQFRAVFQETLEEYYPEVLANEKVETKEEAKKDVVVGKQEEEPKKLAEKEVVIEIPKEEAEKEAEKEVVLEIQKEEPKEEAKKEEVSEMQKEEPKEEAKKEEVTLETPVETETQKPEKAKVETKKDDVTVEVTDVPGVVEVTPKTAQEELTSILKEVSETVEAQSAKVDEIVSKQRGLEYTEPVSNQYVMAAAAAVPTKRKRRGWRLWRRN